jgi:hypothetical protein
MKGRRGNGKKLNTKEVGLKYGFRSGLEELIAADLAALGVDYEYEPKSGKIKYSKPESTYTPDFVLSNKVIIETKGRFTGSDRTKHLLIKKQHPEKDIRFIFQNSRAKLSKGSNTTYAEWCDKHGFKYADKCVPKGWLK